MTARNPFLLWWHATGFDTPDRADLVEVAVAGGIVLACLLAGTLAGGRLGPRLSLWWKTHIVGRYRYAWRFRP